jgi:hypothetical protein
MSRARSLLARVRALEAVGQHPLLAKIGSIERVERIMSQPAPDVDPRAGQFFAMCARRWVDGSDRTSNDPVPEEFRNM